MTLEKDLTPTEKKLIIGLLIFQVWAALVLSVAVIGPLLAIINHLTSFYLGGKDHFSSREFAFNMFRNLVVQGNLISSARWPLRCVFFSWYLFCFYVCGELFYLIILQQYFLSVLLSLLVHFSFVAPLWHKYL